MTIQTLVTIENDTPMTTSYIVAEQLGVEHRSLMQLIKDHQSKIEKHFGFLRFQNAKTTEDEQGRGRPEQSVNLTENQTHYILTLSRNTEEAMEVKALFVKAFAEARQALADMIAATNERITRLEANVDELRNKARGMLFVDGDRACTAINIYHLAHAIGDLKRLIEAKQGKNENIRHQDATALQARLKAIEHCIQRLETVATYESELNEQIIETYGLLLGKTDKKLLN